MARFRPQPFGRRSVNFNSWIEEINRVWKEMYKMEKKMEQIMSRGLMSWEGVNIDLIDRGDHLLLKVYLPGYRPSDIEVEIERNRVALSEQLKVERKLEGQSYLIRERSGGSFKRIVSLPVPVVAEQARGTYKNGVVEIFLPKEKIEKKRRVFRLRLKEDEK